MQSHVKYDIYHLYCVIGLVSFSSWGTLTGGLAYRTSRKHTVFAFADGSYPIYGRNYEAYTRERS